MKSACEVFAIHFLYYFKFAISAVYMQLRLNSDEKKFTVFNSVRSYIPIQMAIELEIALKCFYCGDKIVILIDDGVLLSHDTTHNMLLPSRFKLKIFNSMMFFYRLFGITVLSYSDITSVSHVFDDKECLVEKLRDYWLASIARYTRSSPDEEYIKSRYGPETIDKFKKNAVMSYKIGFEISKRFANQRLVTSHAIYSTWGAFCKGYNDGGKSYVCYGSNGYMPEFLDFAIDAPAANKINRVELERINLYSRSQMRQIRKFAKNMMELRCKSKLPDQVRIKSNRKDSTRVSIKDISLESKGRRIISVFPNVQWDNATSFSNLNIIFKNPFLWLKSIIEFANINKEYFFVIRSHPAEYKLQRSATSLYNMLISGELGDLPTNFLIISSEDKLSSYDLIKVSNSVSVYNGTIGLETIWLKKPLIVAAKAAYTNRGFTYTPRDKEEYFNLLKSPEKCLSAQELGKDRFLKFVYYYFFKTGKDIGVLSKTKYLHPRLWITRADKAKAEKELNDLYSYYIDAVAR